MTTILAPGASVQPLAKASDFSKRLADSANLASNLLVIKISGKLCDSDGSLAKLAGEVKELVGRGAMIILVHGGGKQADAALARAGIATEKKDGIRITPAKAIPVIGEAMSGINKGIVSAFCLEGIAATGIDGIGCSLVRGKPFMERTGTVESVDSAAILALLKKSDVVVLSCLGKDDEGLLNINADQVAQAVSVATKAKKLVLISDVGGVFHDLKDATTLIPSITTGDVDALIKEGAITGGMIPKARACEEAVRNGVGEVVVAAGSVSLLDVIAAREPGCTRFVGPAQEIR